MTTLAIVPTPTEDGGELVVKSTDDVLGLLPVEVRRPLVAPVRDAMVRALTAILQEYERRSTLGAGQSDILQATGAQLDGLGQDYDKYKQAGETYDSLRARILGLDATVTPVTIIGGVDAILAPFIDVGARYFESEMDSWYVHDDDGTLWDSFVYDGTAMASPHYSDRLYPDDATENGTDLASREVLGAWAFDDCLGRYFVLRLPVLDDVDTMDPFAFDETVTDDGMWFADGSDTSGAESDGSVTSFFFDYQATQVELFAAIVEFVELFKGQGIRWQAYVDALLVAGGDLFDFTGWWEAPFGL